jgi:hypothetical protein
MSQEAAFARKLAFCYSQAKLTEYRASAGQSSKRGWETPRGLTKED